LAKDLLGPVSFAGYIPGEPEPRTVMRYALLALLVLVGCDKDPISPEEQIEGTYELVSIDGVNPWLGTRYSATGELVLQDGEYTLDVMLKSHPDIAAQRRLEVGTYSAHVEENGWAFRLSKFDDTGEVYRDGRLTLTWATADLTFRRR
jgi:hypothetical protein